MPYKDKARRIEYQREWRAKNKEKKRLRDNKYYRENKEYRENFLEKHKKYMKKYLNDPERKNKENARMRRYNVKNPEKQKARSIAKKIKIPKNKLCEECKERLAVERHHEDYNKPKKIKFLCKKCHVEEHRKYKIN